MNYRMRNMVALLGIALGSLHPDASRAAVPSPEGPPGRILYVSADGNDDAAGTSLRPFKTLQKGVSVLRPGDTLNVRSGSYDGFLLGWDDGGIYGPIKGTAAAPITIQPGSSSGV